MDPEKSQFQLRWPKRKFRRAQKRKNQLRARRKRNSGGAKNTHLLNYCIARIRGKDISYRLKNSKPKTLVIPIPPKFSFIDDADAALDVLFTLAHLDASGGFRKCDLDHGKCVALDMGASVAFDILVMELDRKWEGNGSSKEFFGHYPKAGAVRDVIRGSGIVKHLNLKHEALPAAVESNYVYLPLQKGWRARGSQIRSTDQDMVAEKVAVHFDSCLKTRGFALTPEGLNYISQLVGEVIDNAEEHSGQDRWFAIGYMDQSEEIGECQLAIVNFGRTIFETLKTFGSARLHTDINALAEKHRSKGLFSQPAWTEENLWTLYSLQDGVSRYTHTAEGVDRGTGTVKMIQFFQRLGDTKRLDKHPTMTLVSGGTQILFDNEFQLKATQVGSEQRQVIAFNRNNSLEEKPSARHVHALRGFFPGVMISMRFYIDKTYLQDLANARN